MGTRSLTYVYDDGETKPFLCMYRQFDGYPSGHGLDLAKFLAPIVMRNGYQMDDKAGTHANGMGCLAAQLVANLKTDIGGIYLYPAETTDAGQEYEYHIYTDRVIVQDAYGHRGNRVLFSGSWKNFLKFCEAPDADESDDVGIDPADEFETLGEALAAGPTTIEFTKVDGTRRIMRATTNVDFIPEDKHPSGSTTAKYKDPNHKRVFDLDKNEWRSYRANNLLNWYV